MVISVPGRFHAFEQAQQLQKRGSLERLITAYPSFEVRKYGLPADKVVSLPLNQVIYRIWAKLPAQFRGLYNPSFMLGELFDKQARRRLTDCDIFVGWSGASLYTLRRAKARGAVIVLERGSTHIVFQQHILNEEYNRCGRKGPLAHPGTVEKELMEYEEADYIAVPSSFVKKTFVDQGIKAEKLIHNPYGVDLTGFNRGKKEDDVFRVIFSGMLSLRKGVHYLLRAFTELNLKNSELLLIGRVQAEMEPFLKQYRRNVKVAGHQKQKTLSQYYSRGSVFVMPSIEEGLALVQLQAMACGLPLICTPNTGGEDLIDDGRDGFLVPARAVDALKEKLLFLYKQPSICAEMGREAREKAMSHFSWDDYGDRKMKNFLMIMEEQGVHDK